MAIGLVTCSVVSFKMCSVLQSRVAVVCCSKLLTKYVIVLVVLVTCSVVGVQICSVLHRVLHSCVAVVVRLVTGSVVGVQICSVLQ